MTAVDSGVEAGREFGRARRRKEDARLVTGRTRWTDNIVLPGMLHLAMVRSPVASGRITSIDVSAARGASGLSSAGASAPPWANPLWANPLWARARVASRNGSANRR